MFLKLFLLSLALIEILGLQNDEEVQSFPTFVYDKHAKTIIQDTVYECKREGPMCEGCEKSVYCLLVADGVYIKYDLETCGSNQTCSENSGMCVTGICDTDSDKQTYDCRMNGIYPDLNDCTKYYMCTEKKSPTVYETHPYVCPRGYYFNSRRGICNMQTTNRCSVANITCTSPGQKGAIPNNPSIYYICLPDSTGLVLPKLFTCLNVKEFDLTRQECFDNSPVIGLNDDGTCRSVGRFYDPSSCMHYMNCNSVGVVPTRVTCGTSYKFNPVSQSCVAFNCNDISC